MRERDHLARGAVRAGRDVRRPAVVQPLREQPAERRGDACVAAEEARESQQHGAAHDLAGQGLADADRPPEQDRALQRTLVLRRDRALCHVPEPRRDAVCDRAAFERAQHRGEALVDAGEQLGRDLDPLAVAHDPPVALEVERVVRVEPDHR